MSHGAPWRCWGGKSGDQEERFRSWRCLFNPGHFGKQEFWEKEEARSASHHPSLLPTSTASHPPPSFSPYSSHFPIPALQLPFTDLPIVSSCSEEGGHSIRGVVESKHYFPETISNLLPPRVLPRVSIVQVFTISGPHSFQQSTDGKTRGAVWQTGSILHQSPFRSFYIWTL